MHADRTNRATLTVLGLVLLLAGGAALAASTGLFGQSVQDHTLLANPVSRYIGRHGDWVWAAAAVACALIALLMLRWLAALLLSTDRAGDLTAAGERRHGTTTIKPAAVTDALTTELKGYRGVQSANARIVGHAGAPRLAVTVTADGNADLARLRRRIETDAFTHTRTALDNPTLPIRLDLGVGRATTSRVR